jgi:hypothetical protein
LATYNWPFRYSCARNARRLTHAASFQSSFYLSRITLLAVTIFCVFGTIVLVAYMYQHRKLKIFKVASPIFLSITLLGCALMYLEVSRRFFRSLRPKIPLNVNQKTVLRVQMAAIFPVLDMYSCIATKWTRHMGFCVSYTALLMKTWR